MVGSRYFSQFAFLAAALMAAFVLTPLCGGDATASPEELMIAQRTRAEAARAAYRDEIAKLQNRLLNTLSTEQGMMDFLAGRSECREKYLNLLRKEADAGILLTEGTQWHPAAALLGEELLDDGRYDDAIAAFRKTLLEPYKPDVKPADFKVYIERLAKAGPKVWACAQLHQGWCCYRLGTLLERQGNARDAVKLYEAALGLEHRPRYALALALTLTLRAEFEKSRMVLAEISQATHESNALIEYHLGYCEEKLWLLEDAQAAYARALKIAQAATDAAQGPKEPPASPDPDGLGYLAEDSAMAAWNLDLSPRLIQQAVDRVQTVAKGLSAGKRDASRKACQFFQEASQLNLQDLLEKTQGVTPVQADLEQGKLFNQYEALISQAVVTAPRFLPAMVKAGIIKLNRDEPDQALIMFKSALDADRDDPSALIYFAQTSLTLASQEVDSVEEMRKTQDPNHAAPDAKLMLEKLQNADNLLKPLPEVGKRLASLLDKHAIGFEICALAECEQVHADSFRVQADPAPDKQLLEQARQDYRRARGRGGRSIDLFEKLQQPDAPHKP